MPADCRTVGRTDEANSLSLLVVAAQCEIRSADRQPLPSFQLRSACSLSANPLCATLPPLLPPLRVCFSNSNRLGRESVLARSSVQKMRRASATRKAFVCDFVAGPGLSKVDNNMDRAGRSRCNRKRQFWIVDSCGCMAAAGLASGTSSQSFPWALHAFRARQINITTG